jgi:RimJ/RimL family protein N-acetyltransferase
LRTLVEIINMPPSFSLRQATPADLQLLLPIVREFYRHFSYPWSENEKQKTLLELLNNASLGQVWIIITNEKPIGYFILSFYYSLEYNGRTAFIDELFLLPENRGQGIGAAILERIVQLGSDLNLKILHLEIEKTNTRASALYEKMGFINYGRMLMSRHLVM